jgi:hypothetical protein
MNYSAIRVASTPRWARPLALATLVAIPLACDQPAPERTIDLAHDPAEPTRILHDPRGDSVALAWAMRQLGQGKWREGYARLVRIAGHEGRLPRRAGTGQAGVPSAAGTDLLVADLLGATLVDAQDELWLAWASLERAGVPEQGVQWLTEPPPWPPASVAKYLRRDGERAMSLTETLAAELAPEPAVRAWLIRSWLAPGRTLDDSVIAELAGAVDGRLCREPRFRAWLRGEWTAWARQRYRRVARWAAERDAAVPG